MSTKYIKKNTKKKNLLVKQNIKDNIYLFLTTNKLEIRNRTFVKLIHLFKSNKLSILCIYSNVFNILTYSNHLIYIFYNS